MLAAAAGRPFIGIEYRPKVRDFARSVDMEQYVIRSDELDKTSIQELAMALDAEPPVAMMQKVGHYRTKLERASRIIRSAVDS